MNSGKYVFAQILKFVSRWEFDKCVERYNGDCWTRELTCWNLFVQLLFGQIESALDVAYIYKNRWQIEVFSKWIKQNLTIKRLWGHSENAVHIHIWVALSAYLLVTYIKAQLRSELSVYEVMQILSISAFDKTPIAELLTEINSNQNIKERPNLSD